MLPAWNCTSIGLLVFLVSVRVISFITARQYVVIGLLSGGVDFAAEFSDVVLWTRIIARLIVNINQHNHHCHYQQQQQQPAM